MFEKELFKAVKNGDINTLKDLLQSGGSVNAEDDSKMTLLHVAARNGNNEIVKVLIEHKADVNNVSCGVTPLHLAAQYNHVEVIKTLVANHANVNAVNFQGKTALHIAYLYNRDEIAAYLLNHGANPDALDNDNNVPNDLNNISKAEVLQQTPKIAISTLNKHKSSEQLIIQEQENKTQFYKEDLEKELFAAVKAGDEETVRSLLERDANPNAANENDWTVLHEACSHYHIGIIQLLLENGADVNAIYSECQTLDKIKNITPLYLICKKGWLSKQPIVRLLWEHGAEVIGFDELCFWNLLFALNGYEDVDLNSIELDLSLRGVGDKELKHLAAALQSDYFANVTKLNLMGNHFSDDGLVFLAAALKKNRLQSLDLSFNNIGSRWLLPSGIKYLIDGLNHNLKMESLNLTGCRLDKSEKQLLNAFWEPKQHYMTVDGLDSLSELRKINSNNDHEAKENYESKYQQQENKNTLYKILIGVLAVVLTPVSLLFTLPIYFYSKKNADIQKLEFTQETYDVLKEKKRLLRERTNYKVEKDDQKPKKVFIHQNEKNKSVYLVDKSQLARFKLFSKHNLGYLKDNAETIANQVQHSIEESKSIVMKNQLSGS